MALSRLHLTVAGDIGCYTLGALAPTNAMDSCLCMGASIGMPTALDQVSDHAFSRHAVAVIGDSTFLHTGIPSLINCVYNRSTCTVIILDNSITGMTGHQQNAASGLDIHNQPAPELDLPALCGRSAYVRCRRLIRPISVPASRPCRKPLPNRSFGCHCKAPLRPDPAGYRQQGRGRSSGQG